MNDNKNKEIFPFQRKNSLKLMIIMTIIYFLSFPGYVKCDMGDTIASLILFLLLVMFICAGIGWWSRRQENK